jgi:putative aldouronate transport system permease protein
MNATVKKKNLWTEIWKHRMVYTLLIPGLIWYINFDYGPMGGLQLAFKTYRSSLGIWGSQWIGFKNFEYVFQDPVFFRAVIRTITLNLGRLICTFPMPIILALALNELRFQKIKRTIQTVLTFPHFLSWVVMASVIINLLGFSGLIDTIIKSMGGSGVHILTNSSATIPMLYISAIWKESGYGTIIYLAAIASIEQEQYESAEIDGANRFQRVIYITFPNILPIIIIMLVMAMGGLLSGSFDQIFNLSNDAVRDVVETLDMYIYRITFDAPPDFGFSTAISLFRSIVNMFFLLASDRIAKALGGTGLFG